MNTSLVKFPLALTACLFWCSQCAIYDDSLAGKAAGKSGGSGTAGTAGNPSATGGVSSVESGDCSDGLINGNETAVDCGGDACETCANGYACKVNLDCQTGACSDETCVLTDCADGLAQGAETDEDCGGPDCPRCKADLLCNFGADCESGVCTKDHCELQSSCKDILQATPDSANGLYWIDVDGAAGASEPFEVSCAMVPLQRQAAGGWTRVAYEPGASAGPQKEGALSHLELEVGTSDQVARDLAPGLIGSRFNGNYTDVMITWGDEFLEFSTPEDLFVDEVNVAIPLTRFVTSNLLLNQWVGNAGVSSDAAIFCRASATGVKPGGTSWAVKSKAPEDANSSCGCSGKLWEGRGLFYGGSMPPTQCADLPVTTRGGGFAGIRQQGEQKGGIQSPTDVRIWVR